MIIDDELLETLSQLGFTENIESGRYEYFTDCDEYIISNQLGYYKLQTITNKVNYGSSCALISVYTPLLDTEVIDFLTKLLPNEFRKYKLNKIILGK